MSSILYTWYSEVLEGFGNFKMEQVFRNVKYANGIVLLAKDETEPRGMIDRLIEIWRCYGMKMNIGGGR